METILYDGILCEVIKHSTMPMVLLQGQKENKDGFQKLMPLKEYEALKAGKKKPTDKWTLTYKGKPQIEGIYALCVKKRNEQLNYNKQLNINDFKIN